MRPRKTKIGTRVSHVAGDSDTTFKVNGQGHRATLLTAALMREAGAVVTVRTYWAWETTTTLRLPRRHLSRLGAHGGGEGRGHIVVAFHLQLVTCCSTYYSDHHCDDDVVIKNVTVTVEFFWHNR